MIKIWPLIENRLTWLASKSAHARAWTRFGCGKEARECLIKNSQYTELAMNRCRQSPGSVGPANSMDRANLKRPAEWM